MQNSALVQQHDWVDVYGFSSYSVDDDLVWGSGLRSYKIPPWISIQDSSLVISLTEASREICKTVV